MGDCRIQDLYTFSHSAHKAEKEKIETRMGSVDQERNRKVAETKICRSSRGYSMAHQYCSSFKKGWKG